jgi:hypothetical protein
MHLLRPGFEIKSQLTPIPYSVRLFDKLQDRFVSVDFVQAKSDILSFINDSSELDLWSSEFFWSITKDRLIV